MVTAGHIAKAMRDIDDEARKNDWVRAIIDVPGVRGGVVDRLAELELPVVPYTGGEAPIDKERFVNARAEDYWTLRERFEQGEIDIDPHDDKLAAQLGSIKWGIDSRGRIKIESKDDMRKRGLPSPDSEGRRDGHRIRGQRQCCADECGESLRRKHHRGSNDQGMVTVPVGCHPEPWPLSVSSGNHSGQGEGHDHRPIHGDKTASDDLAEEDCAHRGLALPAHLCLDPDPRSVWIGARSELHHRSWLE